MWDLPSEFACSYLPRARTKGMHHHTGYSFWTPVQHLGHRSKLDFHFPLKSFHCPKPTLQRAPHHWPQLLETHFFQTHQLSYKWRLSVYCSKTRTQKQIKMERVWVGGDREGMGLGPPLPSSSSPSKAQQQSGIWG